MEFKSFMEALKGKQHKIDKNKNGKVDSHDFELLRKEETEELEEATVKTQNYSWGTMKTVHQGSDFSIPLHPEHHKEIAKLKDEQEHKFKTEDGKSWTARRKGDDVHFQGANGGNSTTVKHSTMSESVEDLDEIRRMKTKLSSLDPISHMSVARQKLSDLMKSSKARGAMIANKRRTLNMGEEVEIEENAPVAPVPDRKYIKGTPENKALKDSRKPINGMPTNKMKEETEQIEEAKPGLYANIHAKKKRIEAGSGERMRKPGSEGAPSASDFKDAAKTANEEFKLDEANHRTLASLGRMHPNMAKHMTKGHEMDFYAQGSGDKISGVVKHNNGKEVHVQANKDGKLGGGHMHKFKVSSLEEAKMTTQKDKNGKLISFKYEGDWKKSSEKKEGSGKAANLAGQAMQKMKSMTEEKDEQEYGYEGDMALNQLATLTRCAEMIKEILKPDTDMPEWVQSKITLATDYIQTAADYMHSEMNEAKSVDVKVNAAGDAAHEEKWEPVKKIKKPVKESFDDEGNLIANKVSYKEFMLEYTPGPGGVTQIKGRSYGASYSDPEGADDYDDKKPMKPAAEKRGRGRPAGAKSGARKITGTSKLMNK